MEKLFALIQNAVVRNVIVADAWPGAIDVTTVDPRPAPGWGYNGTAFTAPAPSPPVVVTQIDRVNLLARMTPVEFHAWQRAAQRALATNSPVAADRNGLYAWSRWEAMNGVVDLTSGDIQGLKSVWVALGMTQARADELLTPLMQG